MEIVNQVMDKIGKDFKETGKADVFKWFIMMTTDVLGELAFGEPFRMVEKEEVSVWCSCILRETNLRL